MREHTFRSDPPTPRHAPSVVALGLLISLVAGCGGGSDEGGPAGSGDRQFLSLGTAPPGGAFFVVGGALAEVLNEFGPEGWEVTAEATKGSKENIRRLDRGEIDFALSNAAITFFAVRGGNDWEKPYAMRSLMTLAPNVGLFIAPRSSGVTSLADLKGRRVVIGPAGAGFEDFLQPLLAAHGVAFSDFSPLNATQAGAVDLLADGSAAAAFLGGAIPTASITQAATSQDIVYIPYDAGALETLFGEYAFFETATIPAGTYRGLDQDYVGLDVGSMHLITAAAVSDDLAYEVTKALWENREAVAARHPAGRAINPRVAIRDTGTEFHPGAVRFYREIGVWPEAASEPAPDSTTDASGAGQP